MGETICKASAAPCYEPYVTAARNYDADSIVDFEIDGDPIVRSTDGGVWVQAWVWVRDEDITLPEAPEHGPDCGYWTNPDQVCTCAEEGARLAPERPEVVEVEHHTGFLNDEPIIKTIEVRADGRMFSKLSSPSGSTEFVELFRCAHPQCPGYPYKASDIRHPCDWAGPAPAESGSHEDLLDRAQDAAYAAAWGAICGVVGLHNDEFLEGPTEEFCDALREFCRAALKYAEGDTEPDESMDGDHESALASAGFGTDEDYGLFEPSCEAEYDSTHDMDETP